MFLLISQDKSSGGTHCQTVEVVSYRFDHFLEDDPIVRVNTRARYVRSITLRILSPLSAQYGLLLPRLLEGALAEPSHEEEGK